MKFTIPPSFPPKKIKKRKKERREKKRKISTTNHISMSDQNTGSGGIQCFCFTIHENSTFRYISLSLGIPLLLYLDQDTVLIQSPKEKIMKFDNGKLLLPLVQLQPFPFHRFSPRSSPVFSPPILLPSRRKVDYLGGL